MSNHSMKEVTYRCTTPDCNHEQTVRDRFIEDVINQRALGTGRPPQ